MGQDIPKERLTARVFRLTASKSNKIKCRRQARKGMAAAQKARWAKLKGAPEIAGPAPEAPKPKRQIHPEGMKNIIAATKRRWRRQKAASKSKAALAKSAEKKVAKKASVKKTTAKTPASAPAAAGADQQRREVAADQS